MKAEDKRREETLKKQEDKRRVEEHRKRKYEQQRAEAEIMLQVYCILGYVAVIF